MTNIFKKLMGCFYDDAMERIADSLETISITLKDVEKQNAFELKEVQDDLFIRAQSEEWKLLTEMSAVLSEIKHNPEVYLSTNTTYTIQNLLERMTKLIVGDKVFVPAKE